MIFPPAGMRVNKHYINTPVTDSMEKSEDRDHILPKTNGLVGDFMQVATSYRVTSCNSLSATAS